MKKQVGDMNQFWTEIYYYLRYPHQEKISHQSVRIMQVIEKEKEVGIKKIAESIQVSHNTASEHVKRLLEKEYIIKTRSKEDERRVILKLTASGQEILHRHSSLDEEKLTHVFEAMTAEERQTIIDGFALLKEKAQLCTRS
ncbi:MarR family winged helix-turn-helix transcriptional regulator [Priestia taiwanensis]|uniref:MarR family transcriptional regulator n=1 Tax=Priestia taiwanensis TaxID=1347902 RepID=A0A917AQY9_9BACI|nr:MarR family transcriptional regulator [Priestia taiwanensis]MBM7362630.1 DNA-binding MarR family transcriptional regulator [Priestia taiwanensis]GGE63800.1 MarR family transcriptional regulator [Priestia taiwanensis]